MDELAVKARREYQREWRRKNKDKVKQHQKDFWLRQAKKLAEKGEGSNGDRCGNC